jgi:hypothetical protein
MLAGVKSPRFPLVLFSGLWLMRSLGAASDPTPATEGPTVQLPDMKVEALYRLEDFKFPAKSDLVPGDFARWNPPLNITFPNRAFFEGVPKGRASVGVMLDEKGQATDYLLIRYTQKYFGDSLLRNARHQKFAPRRLEGSAVPGVFIFTYEFLVPPELNTINTMDAITRRMEKVNGGPKLLYNAHREAELDGAQLDPLRVVVPELPAGFKAPPGLYLPVRALVTFFVDEEGRVRLPNVESSLPPALVSPAIVALQQWTFKPPTIKGQPVLAQAMRALTFRAADAAPAARGGQPYHDNAYAGGAQKIPGAVFCAYYDLGGEGVAFHDSDTVNQGSGKLNPADGSYLNEFRKQEAPDISYTKPEADLESPCNKVVPPPGLLYVGWNDPGDWFNVTVETAAAGDYVADLLYTANRDASFSISVNGGAPATVPLASTFDPAEAIAWRQWHHWNTARDAVALSLPKGTSVLTFRVVTGGNFNLATLLFRPAGTARRGPDVTAYKTAQP